MQPTLAQAAHHTADVREAPDRPGNGGLVGWVAVCVCGHEGWPMQGPRSAQRWLTRHHIDPEVTP